MKKSILLSMIMASVIIRVSGQSDVSITENTINIEESISHVWFLASDELKGRNTGSSEIDIAAAYIASRFRSYGVRPIGDEGSYYQHVPLKKTKPPTEGSFSAGSFTFNLGETLIVMHANEIKAEAEVYYSEYAMPEELVGKDLEGKIVVTRAGSPSESNPRAFFVLAAQKREAVMATGAIALIEIYNSNELPWSTLLNYLNREQISVGNLDEEDAQIAHAWVHDSQNALLEYISNEKKPVAKISMGAINITPLPSKNVVGMIEGTDPNLKNEYILISAHYDHIGIKHNSAGEDTIFNGARDNAIGISALLSAARSLAMNPPKRSVLFLACTAEEKGLLGSRYYAENPPVPLNQIVFNLNTDGGGYNDKSKASIMGLTRTNAEEAMVSACEDFGLEAFADPAPEQNLFDRSDNVNFARLGIPAPTFSTGFTSFDEEILKYYHQVTDNPENVDYVYVSKFLKAFTLAARRIGNMDEKPFWNAGDKYEAAGKKLYGIE